MSGEPAKRKEEADKISHLKQQVTACREIAKQKSRRLRALTLEMVGAEERERRRIAGILHGDLQQVLFGARLQLQSLLAEDYPLSVLKNLDQLLKEAISIMFRPKRMC